MTNAQLEKRVEALEKTVEELKAQLNKPAEKQEPWWITGAGRFANDPLFDEMVQFVREYRESLDPDLKSRKNTKKGKAKGGVRDDRRTTGKTSRSTGKNCRRVEGSVE